MHSNAQRQATETFETVLGSDNVIFTDQAPLPLGTYSQGIKVGQTVYLSAQTPVNPKDNEVWASDFEGQLRQTLENLKVMAQASGGSLANVVKVTAFITDLSEFPTLNRVMEEFFTRPYPARTTAGASALARGTLVAIDAIMVV
ncbi:Rid family detoxifying hydrolase [Pseudomonas sp. RIT-To-2]|uniref:Rid family detoxifying hydrolase n=1 Tax=Pseudomonas sp. RIT-To-2 TaxID=3462541 RepID=UPI0024130798